MLPALYPMLPALYPMLAALYPMLAALWCLMRHPPHESHPSTQAVAFLQVTAGLHGVAVGCAAADELLPLLDVRLRAALTARAAYAAVRGSAARRVDTLREAMGKLRRYKRQQAAGAATTADADADPTLWLSGRPAACSSAGPSAVLRSAPPRAPAATAPAAVEVELAAALIQTSVLRRVLSVRAAAAADGEDLG